MSQAAATPPSSAVPVLLASTSPRRRVILRMLGIEPRLASPGDAESAYDGHADPHRFAVEQATAKLAAVDAAPGELALAADTIVVLAGAVLGKPADTREAAAMLARLAGRTHEVVTALAVRRAGRQADGHAVTRVTFRDVAETEIAAYVATGEPLDKAGAYGIQDRGAVLVRRVEGCFFNVMGLPVALLLDLLPEVGLRYDLGGGIVEL